jgi:hypothetical protein
LLVYAVCHASAQFIAKLCWDSNHIYRGESLPFMLRMLVAAEDITVAISLLQWHWNNILFFVP